MAKTHLRDLIVLSEMVGSVVGRDKGKTFTQEEIKPEMIGRHLGEFSITCKPGKHGPPGLGATHSSRFIPSNEGTDFSKGKQKQKPKKLMNLKLQGTHSCSPFQDQGLCSRGHFPKFAKVNYFNNQLSI